MTVGGAEAMSTFDAPLLGILQSCGELEPFLDVVLGFLYRKTDFFFPLAADQSMGFPPGAAQAKLLKVFRKYEKMRDTTQLSPQHSPPTPPVTPSNTSTQPQLQPQIQHQIQPQPQVQQAKPQAPVVEDNLVQGSCECVAAIDIVPSEEKEEIQGNWSTAAWDHHNGGYTETYAWSQTAQDVELKLPVPANTKARDLTIDIKAHSIKAQRMTASGPVVMMEQKLHDPIKTEDSMWSLHKGEYVQLTLEKARDGYWWTAMFKDGVTVPLDSIDTTRSIVDLGNEEQSCVQKLMFDQMQKKKGLPTSDDMNTEEILKKAWHTEGSPFAGTPYEPGRVTISTDGSIPGAGV